MFTIDPADARDFDDALSLDPAQDFLRDGVVWRLGVHIADVSHYVPWNSSLDLDARRRATSVYLVDRVIPMLPEQLSNGLCSLNPNETRRCMTCDVYLDQDWKAVGYDIYPALMRSQARLTYGQVQQALDGDAALPDDIMQRVRFLSQFAKARIAARQVAGGLDFDFPEARVVLDDDGKPLRVDLRRKTEATSLVEEAMILANEVVAQHLSERGFPALYRVHEKPSPDSLAALLPVLQEFVGSLVSAPSGSWRAMRTPLRACFPNRRAALRAAWCRRWCCAP